MPDPTPMSFLPLPHLPFHILLALAEGDQHGWALVKRIEGLTSGITKPSSGSLYLALNRLKARGLVGAGQVPAEATDARRQYHSLTNLGRQVLQAEVSRLQSLVVLAKSSGIETG